MILADKGRALVIIEVNDYLKPTTKRCRFLCELTHNPTSKHGDIVNKKTIKSFIKDKLISEQLGKNPMNTNPKTLQ